MSMLKIFIVSVYLASFSFNVTGDYHFIGLTKNEIKNKMDEQMDEFNLDNSTVNKSFNYLKYVDYLGQQTILYFMDENDICTASKWMCDYSLLDEKINLLNNLYQNAGENTWKYEQDGTEYQVKLEEEEWFFSMITKPKS